MSLIFSPKRLSSDVYHLQSPADTSSPTDSLFNEGTTRRSYDGRRGDRRDRRRPLIRGSGFDYSLTSSMGGVPNGKMAGKTLDVEMQPIPENSFIQPLPSPGYRSACTKDLYFRDGKRRVDYVLCHEVDDNEIIRPTNEEIYQGSANGQYDTLTVAEKRAIKRTIFEENLKKLGLELEYVDAKCLDKIKFTLVHAPFEVLMRQAENLAVKMPVLQSDVKERTIFEGVLDQFLNRFKFLTFDSATNERLKEPNYFTAPFIAAHLDCYVGHENKDTFFDEAERSRMVYDLLIRTRYDLRESEKFRVGIERLVKNNTYTAAYPLHESCESVEYDPKRCSNREMLYFNWARFTNFYKYQPLSLITKYFGSKIGIYFAWLGFYTKMLFPASLVGLICFLYGLATFSSDIPSNDICGTDGIGADVLMCPSCIESCEYRRLSASCIYSKLTYVFDNYSTVAFAGLMAIGATLFLEGWKRYHAEIAWKWGLLDFEVDEETIRPEYQLRVKSMQSTRLNPITQEEEPTMPFKVRLFKLLGSASAVIFFLLLVLAFVFGVILYRTLLTEVFQRVDNVKDYANLLTVTTAAVLNLIFILIMSQFYTYLALKLTEWECPRTQTEFDNSYTFKVFLFQFINYYSSIFYVAFIKGNLTRVPGGTAFGLAQEQCDPAGCMVDLVIQLAIIMCGKQFFNAFMEVAYPIVMNWFRSWRYKIIETQSERLKRIKSQQFREKSRSSDYVPRWEKDYVLNPVMGQYLFDEYLEMVIQFGFVTLFVCAFPLAPLFALINNILEIRVDAYKFTMIKRRPLPEKAKDIGVWLPILDGISKVAVLVNAFVIAFTSDFIPKLVYLFVYEHDDLYGYVNNSLSVYDASYLNLTKSSFENVTVCRYRDYRRPPCSLGVSSECDDNYSLTKQWWIVLAFRLSFVLIFEHVVYMIKGFVAYVIPDMPTRIFIQLQRQRYLARQARLSDLGSSGPSSGSSSERGTITPSVKLRQPSGETSEVAFQPGEFSKEDADLPDPVREVLRSDSINKITPHLERKSSIESFKSAREESQDEKAQED